jgi:hypothetical protein
MTVIILTAHALSDMTDRKLCRLAALSQMLMDCAICTAMYWNGVATGMENIAACHRPTLRALHRDPTMLSGVVASTAMLKTADRLIGKILLITSANLSDSGLFVFHSFFSITGHVVKKIEIKELFVTSEIFFEKFK